MSTELLMGVRALHLISVVLWAGGLVAVLAMAARGEGPVVSASRRVLVRLVHPAMAVAWLAALVMLANGWSALYAKAGWMHGKIMLGLILSALTGVVAGKLRKAAEDPNASAASFRVFAVVSAAIAAAIILLATFRVGS